MFLGFLASITALLPWLLGAALGLRFGRLSDIQGFSAIAAGTGGFLGYLAVAFALWYANRLSISLLNNTFLLALGVITALAIATLWPSERRKRFFKPIRPITASISALLVLHAAYSVFISVNMPAHGWDVLDFWSRFAAQFVEHSMNDHTVPFFSDQSPIHPHTASFILVWSTWCGTQYGGGPPVVWSIPWLGFYLSAGLLVGGWGYNQTKNLNVALVLVLGAITIPLLENHALIGGYAELLIALAIVSGTVLAAMAIQERARSVMAAALFVSFTPIFLKNTGAAYALAPLLASVFVWSVYPDVRKCLTFAFICGAAAIYIWNNGFLLQWADLRLAFDSDDKIITFGLRTLKLMPPPWSELLANEIQSRLLNNSFSISLIAISLCLISVWKRGARSITAPLTVVTASFAILLAQQFLSQFTEYGLKYAGAGSDTGLSRFSLPAFMLVPIITATLLRLVTYQSLSHIRLQNNAQLGGQLREQNPRVTV